MNSLSPAVGNSESSFEVIMASKPNGPPLTSGEQALRVGFALALVGLLAIEAWLLWSVWTLWA
ncbi:MAG TPA: hypothetical protein VK449_05445 [Anaerolineales bacterium]|nr:hypothetical protein [Anaerolineales bacterium]